MCIYYTYICTYIYVYKILNKYYKNISLLIFNVASSIIELICKPNKNKFRIFEIKLITMDTLNTFGYSRFSKRICSIRTYNV